MKILQIIHDFLPNHTAGSELYTYQVSKELSKTHEVRLFFTEYRADKVPYSIEKGSYDGLAYYEVNKGHQPDSFKESYLDPRMDDIFLEIVEEFNPDIIHIQHLANHSIRYVYHSQQLGISVVYTLHEYWITCPRWGQRLMADGYVCHQINVRKCGECMLGPNNLAVRVHANKKLYRILEAVHLETVVRNLLVKMDTKRMQRHVQIRTDDMKEMCAHVDLFLAPSRFLMNKFIDFGISENKIVFSPYGFEKKYIDTSGNKKSEDKLRLGFVGTINYHKGVHVLIDAFNKIPRGSAELLIYGDLNWFPDYLSSLQKNQSPDIQFLGGVNNKEIPKILSQLDVLVVPSIWFENAPLTIQEAFLTNTPVITSDFGGMAELVDNNINGLLFKVGDSDDLADKIMQLINDREFLTTLARNPSPVRTVKDDAKALEHHYQRLICSNT